MHDKTESQDVCFVEGGDYRDVLERVRPGINSAGNVISITGELLGEHAGIANYTVGQRALLPPSGNGPRFVTRIDATTNTIVVGDEGDLLAGELLAGELNLIRPERFTRGDTPVRAMIRYRTAPARASATVLDGGRVRLRFEQAQRAIAPGQLVALLDLDSEEVLGAATISMSS